MKKLLTALLCATMVLGVSGCGGESKNPAESNKLSVEELLTKASFTTEMNYDDEMDSADLTISNNGDYIITYHHYFDSDNWILAITKNDKLYDQVVYSSDDKPTANVEDCSILLDTETQDEDDTSSNCTDALINDAKEVKKSVNEFLNKYGLTAEELQKYCNQYVNNNLDKVKAGAEEKKKKEQEEKKAAAEQKKEDKKNFIKACKTYSYKDIFRNAEKYEGKQAKFTGEVIQVMDVDGGSIMRVNVTKDEYGYYDDTIYVEWADEDKNNDPAAEKRFIEDDIITIYGELGGTETYESTMGGNVTIPKLYAKYIKLNK